MRGIIRLKHYSKKTEKTHVSWIRCFILFHGKRHPEEMGEREIEAFLSHLAVNRKVVAVTPNQAFNAILFPFRAVLGKKLDDSIDAVRAKKTRRLPKKCGPSPYLPDRTRGRPCLQIDQYTERNSQHPCNLLQRENRQVGVTALDLADRGTSSVQRLG